MTWAHFFVLAYLLGTFSVFCHLVFWVKHRTARSKKRNTDLTGYAVWRGVETLRLDGNTAAGLDCASHLINVENCTVVGDYLPAPEKGNTIYIGKPDAYLKIYGGKATIVGDGDIVAGIEHALGLVVQCGERGSGLYTLGFRIPVDDIERPSDDETITRIGFGDTYFQVRNAVASIVGAECDDAVDAMLSSLSRTLRTYVGQIGGRSLPAGLHAARSTRESPSQGREDQGDYRVCGPGREARV